MKNFRKNTYSADQYGEITLSDNKNGPLKSEVCWTVRFVIGKLHRLEEAIFLTPVHTAQILSLQVNRGKLEFPKLTNF